MHQQLFEDPTSYLLDFVAPGRMLSGKGTILVFMNDMIFRVMKGKLVPIFVATFVSLQLWSGVTTHEGRSGVT